MSVKKPTAIVIGSGVAGSASAARLAVAGFDVTVLERNDFTGGRCSLINHEGHRFDQGPSLLLLPKLFEETFADLGTTMPDEGITLKKCEPNYVVHFGDGEKFILSTDGAIMKREVERFEGRNGFEGYLGFLTEAHRHYELSVEHVLHKNFTSYFSMLRIGFLRQVFALHPFTSIYSRASHYFKTDRLRRVFTFASMYMGMSPMDAPGTYSLLQYTELAEGIWYSIGGFHSIIAGLNRIAVRNGANIRLSTPVSKVLVDPKDPKRATGVLLENGETLDADVVVVNADLIWSMNNLFEPTGYAKRLAKKTVSCSSISFYWSVDRVVKELGIHSIFLADEYEESFDSIFKKKDMPNEPSFYVNVPSRVDPSAAPEGQDSLVILVPVGHITDKISTSEEWKLLVDRAREHVYATLAVRLGLTELKSWVKNEIINDPITWRDKFNLHQGSILGLSHSFFNVLCFRPSTRHPTIDNSYFCGASTLPGTGVPICLAGAKLTTTQILNDLEMSIPWEEHYTVDNGAAVSQGIKVLDKSQSKISGFFTLIPILLAFFSIILSLPMVRAASASILE